jgi:hypothetical protein
MSTGMIAGVKKVKNSRGSSKLDSIERADLLHALQAVPDGDFSVRLPSDRVGLEGKIADTFNEIIGANARMAEELTRVGQTVGKQGKTGQRVRFGRRGLWAQMEGVLNALIDDLLSPTTAVTRAIAAVAQGDLQQTVPLEVEGRPLEGQFLRSRGGHRRPARRTGASYPASPAPGGTSRIP